MCARTEFSLPLLEDQEFKVTLRTQTVCIRPGLHSLYRVSREFTFELTVVSTLLSLPFDTQLENEAEVE